MRSVRAEFAAFQRLRTRDFRRFAPSGLPDRYPLATPLGKHLFMPPPSPVEQVAQAYHVVGDHVRAKHRTHLACAAQL